MECNALLEDLRPENISHEVVVDAADRLKALKFKVNSVSPKTQQVLALVINYLIKIGKCMIIDFVVFL